MGAAQKIVLACVLALLFHPLLSLAQNLSPVEIPDSVRLNITFPADGDTVISDRVRYSGSVLPNASVTVHGQSNRVYGSGAFVGTIDLKAGENRFLFSVQDSLGELTDSLRVYRTPPKTSLLTTPTALLGTEVEPQEDIWVSPGDFLEVGFRGSPGGRATFSIHKIAKNVHMGEIPSRSGKGLKGRYKGSVVVPELRNYKPKPVEYKLRGKDGRQIKIKSKG